MPSMKMCVIALAFALAGCGASGGLDVAEAGDPSVIEAEATEAETPETTTSTSTSTTTSTVTTTTVDPGTEYDIALTLWRNEALGPMEDILDSFDAIFEAADAVDFDGVTRACQDMVDATERALAAVPAPDAEVERHWQAALADFHSGGSMCITAMDNLNGDLLEVAIDVIMDGTEDLELATDALSRANERNR